MGTITAYSLGCAIYLTAMYLGYKWLLSNENRPGFNRLILLSICFTAMIAPAISLLPGSFSAPGAGTAVIDDITPDTELSLTPEQPTLIMVIPIIIYFLGVSVCLIRLLSEVIVLRRIIAHGHHQKKDTYTLVITDNTDIAPFSWLNYIVINRDDYANSLNTMLLHESCHTASRHWLDIAFVRLTAIFQWYNPAAWLLCRELKSVHEFQADSQVLAAGVDPRDYQMLLIKKAVGSRFPSLANNLNHSQLKKRVTMMYKSKSATAGIRAAIIVPALFAGWFISTIPAVASVTTGLSETALYSESAAVPEYTPEEDEQVFKSVTKRPQFPGGEKALMEFMVKNIKYPAEAVEQKIQGRVIVRFVVNSDGKVHSPEVMRKVNPLLDAEAIRIIKSLPDFEPGELNGKKVSVWYTLPVMFKL